MKKLYTQLLSAFFTENPGHIKAIKIFFLALLLSGAGYNSYAQVTVTPATGGTAICSNTALSGPSPSCTTLGAIIINETTNADFATGADQIVLAPPAGWQFCTGLPLPVVSVTGGGNLSGPTIVVLAGSATINVTSGGITLHDQLTITGLRVEALTPAAAPGYIYASSQTGVAGIAAGPAGTNFGNLALIPSPTAISTSGSPFTVCTGNCVTFSSTPAGGVWTSSNPAVATVGSSTGLVCGISSGVATITYTVGGCSVTQNITVNSSPPPFVVPNMCAWFDSVAVHDAVAGGVYSSTLVTVVNSGLSDGNGEVFAHAPGTATITYSLPTGCSITETITINPLPAPIMAPPYEVCQGSTKLLTDVSPGGTWTSTVVAVATVGAGTGLVTGISPGITHIKYTFPATGCKTDTSFVVDPLPAPILGPDTLCVGATVTLTDATSTGTWSSSNIGVATIGTFTGLVSGVSGGTTTISYTLATGCASTVVVTVDPLPSAIAGPTNVCVNDSILLTDGTPGGTWTSSNTPVATVNAITGWVTGVTPGVAIISYSIFPGGCKATYSVTVNPLPAPILGPDSLCVGTTVTETDATPAGTWSSSPAGYLFIDPVGFVTGISPGVDTIYYTLGTGCRVSKPVTVDAIPLPIGGPDSVCVGQTIAETDPTPGGTWSSLAPAVGSIDPVTGIFTGLTPGTAVIRYTNGSGCSVQKTIIVGAIPPAIGGPTSVCVGDSVTVTDALAGGTWSSSNIGEATIDPVTGVVHGISGGSITITYSRGGCSVSEPFVINNKKPIFGPNQVCVGDTIVLSDSVGGAATWGNLHPNIDSIIGTGGTIVNTALVIGKLGGVDTIVYTLSTGCVSTFPVTVNPISPILGIFTVCVGSSIDLGDATPGGKWASSDTSIAKIDSITGHLTGTGPGNVTITYTMPTGCQASAVVTVNPLPTAIFGPNQVCVGQSIALVDTTLVGAWSFSPPGIVTIVSTPSDSAVIMGVSAGTAVIKYAIGSGCFVVDTITVNPLSPILGPNQVCVGSNITLVDTTHVGAINPWTLYNADAGFVSFFDSSVTITGLTAGVDTLYFTVPVTGCMVAYPVTVNPLPAAIIGSDSVCVGATTIFVDDSLGGNWTSSNGGIASVFSTFDSSATIFGVSAGTVTITYTLPTGCLATKGLVVNPSPGAILGPNHVCLGRFITLSDPTAGGYWTSSNTGVATVDNSGHIVTFALGTTVIEYTLPVGRCAAALVVTVTPIPVITVAPTPPGMICKGGSQTLTASGAGTPGGGPGTYSWAPSYALNTTFGPTVVASPTITTTYTVTGTTQFGCDSFTTFTVVVDSALYHLHISGSDSICNGACDQLIATGNPASLYDWHPHTGLSVTIGDTVLACPDVTTTYTAVAIDFIGCKDSVSFTVTVNPVPVIVVDKNPVIVCRGLPTQVYVFTTNTDTTRTLFTWTPNLFISCDTCYNPIFTDTFNLVYRVIATTQYGCFDSLNVKVNVLDTNVNTISNDTNICIGGSAQLIALSHSLTGNLDIPTYTWIPDTGLNNPFIYNPVATPTTTTTYSVAIHENQCFSDTLTETVFVQPLPAITITPPSQNIVAGTPIQLMANVTNVTVSTYAWTPANTLSCDSCANPVAIPVGPVTYTVIVTSIYGCQSIDTVSFTIFCDNSQVFVPNTFTPNGDGVNDRFFISAKGIKLITRMSVYNRWGQLVFEAHDILPNDAGAGWDGSFKGVVLQPDVFVYVVEALCELGTPFKYTGDISIVK